MICFSEKDNKRTIVASEQVESLCVGLKATQQAD
jgi:hypothetical protein